VIVPLHAALRIGARASILRRAGITQARVRELL